MKKAIAWLLAFLSMCTTDLVGQHDNYFAYSLDEGLPQSQVFCLTQDRHGFIWAGTQGGGVARYDGNAFKVFTTQQGLSADFINALHASEINDDIYIGTSRGLNCITHMKVQAINLQDSKSTFVTALSSHGDRLYCGSSDGMYIINTKVNKQISDEVFLKLNKHYINAIKSIGNEVWIGTNKGLWIYNTDTQSLVKSNKTPQPNVASIYEDHSGMVWLAIIDYGVLCIKPSSKSIVIKIVDENIKKCLSLNLDDNNMLWMATQYNGLYRYNLESKELVIIKDKDFTATRLRVLYRDFWDNLWIGTSGEGIIKKANQTFKHFHLSDYGFNSNKVYSIYPYIKDQVIFATADNSIVACDGNYFTTLFKDSSHIKIKSIIVDTAHTVWLGTEGKGLIKVASNGIREEYSYSNGRFSDDIIVQVLYDADHRIWVATNSSGIISIQGEDRFIYNVKKGLSDDYIAGISSDSDRNLWYATKKGGIGYITKSGKIFKIKADAAINDQPIKSIAIDKQDNVYFTVTGLGLYRYIKKNKNIEKVQVKQKPFSNNIYSMVFSKKGNLWLGAENGAYELIIDSHNNIADVLYYSKGDGFLGLECCHNSSCIDTLDNVWFGTMNGISVLNNASRKEMKKSPILHLSDILLYYKPVQETKYSNSFYKNHTLPYDQNHISFQFKALHLNHSDKIKYRYKLESADQNWSGWESQDEVNYANLASGDYTFKIQASLDGQYLSKEIAVPFTIDTPFWQQWWFRIVASLATLATIVYVFKKREQNIRAKEAQRNKDLKLQNELLSLEQKALQLQMNPHFIFNALNSIQSVIVDQDVDKARQEIQNFALLMRSILNNSRKKSISLNEELQTMQKYLELEQFCQKNKFVYTISIADDIDTEETEIPSMLIQPYIENAVIHGIAHLKSVGHITIEFKKENDVLICIIIDNGVGRTKAKELALGTKSHVSLGMEVTETRLNNYAANKIENPQTIEDLYDDKGHAIGSKVILKMPITTSY